MMDYEHYEGLGRVTKKDNTWVLCTYTRHPHPNLIATRFNVEVLDSNLYSRCNYTVPADRSMPSA